MKPIINTKYDINMTESFIGLLIWKLKQILIDANNESDIIRKISILRNVEVENKIVKRLKKQLDRMVSNEQFHKDPIININIREQLKNQIQTINELYGITKAYVSYLQTESKKANIDQLDRTIVFAYKKIDGVLMVHGLFHSHVLKSLILKG